MYCHVFQTVCFQHVRTCTDFPGELRLWEPIPLHWCCSCAVHLTEDVMAVRISYFFSRKIVHELPTLPLQFRPVELPASGKIRVSTPETQGKTVPGKIVLQIMRSHIRVSILWPQGDEQDKFFSSSDLQLLLPNTELLHEKALPSPVQTAAWERQEAPQGCIPVAGMWQATSQAELQIFLKLCLGEALASTGCCAVQGSETGWQERHAFLLKGGILLPGSIFTPFFLSLYFRPVRIPIDTAYIISLLISLTS